MLPPRYGLRHVDAVCSTVQGVILRTLNTFQLSTSSMCHWVGAGSLFQPMQQQSAALTLAPCRRQDDATGKSALMAAAGAGATEAVEALLGAGAPWNAIDRRGRCAGDCAMEGDHAGAAGAILEAGSTPVVAMHLRSTFPAAV